VGHAGGLWVGVAVNVAALVAFKYTVFPAGTIAGLLGEPAPPLAIVLPILISFFTFQLA
jgi:D-alanyl-lipoteichoic acid acyltransferase DltB (MBOAT superfamily)